MNDVFGAAFCQVSKIKSLSKKNQLRLLYIIQSRQNKSPLLTSGAANELQARRTTNDSNQLRGVSAQMCTDDGKNGE